MTASRLGRFLWVIHHDDFALDIVLHVLFKLGGGSGHGVINIQLLDIKDSGQGFGLCTALDTGAIQANGNILLMLQQIAQDNGGLGTVRILVIQAPSITARKSP